MQDDLVKVKCMYCGVDVIVQEAIQLARGRVKEFTSAEPLMTEVKVSSEVEGKPKAQTIICFALAALCVVAGIGIITTAQGKVDEGFFRFGGGVSIFMALVFFVAGIPKQGKPAEYKTVPSGWKGECPYCSTVITLPLAVGADCYACNKRIVIRESNFQSIDTPVSGIETGALE